jgi:hypothetical protein
MPSTATTRALTTATTATLCVTITATAFFAF